MRNHLRDRNREGHRVNRFLDERRERERRRGNNGRNDREREDLHLELIRFELGFLGVLDAEFLVPPPGIPMRMVRCDELLSLGSRSDRKPGLYATGFFFHTGGIAAKISMICHVARTHSDDVLGLVLTITCQDRYACDVKDVNADFLTIMAALVKSGICSKAR